MTRTSPDTHIACCEGEDREEDDGEPPFWDLGADCCKHSHDCSRLQGKEHGGEDSRHHVTMGGLGSEQANALHIQGEHKP